MTPPAPPLAVVNNLPKGSGELVLVIDDDDGIRWVVEKILTAHGYEVCTSPDGQCGLAEFERQRERFELVICDEVMPGMRGGAVLDQIQLTAPSVKRIAMSGFLEELSGSNVEGDSSVLRLAKPLTSESLLRTVLEALGGLKAP